MKRWCSFLLIISLLFGVSACGTSESSKVSETQEEKKIQIGLTFDSFVIERWQRDRDVFVSVAKELGAEVNVPMGTWRSRRDRLSISSKRGWM